MEVLAVVFAVSVMVGFLYSWLGLAYATVFMVSSALMGFNVNSMLPYILLSQAIISPFATVIRGRNVVDVGLHFRGSLVIGLSALVAFLAALMLGIRVSGYVKLVFTALLLVFASIINMLKDEDDGERRNDCYGLNVVIGVVAGFLKGVFGSGALPVLIGFQRLMGLSVDETVFRVFLSVSIVALASSVPYILNYGLEPTVFISVLSGSILGVFLSSFALEIKYKRELLTIAMLTLAIALILNLTVLKLWV